MDVTVRILLSVALFALFFILVNALLRHKAKGVINKIGQENVLLVASNANFFGQQSARFSQIRGNGTLVLTKDKLYFELFLPRRIIEIPLGKIESIQESSSYLGRITLSKLIKVNYRNKSNSVDSCAWLVRNRKEWINLLEQLME